MMKIGLCVRYDCNNFGSMLQILATQKMITRFGGEYEIIRYDKKTPFFMLTNITRIFNPYFMRGWRSSLKSEDILIYVRETRKESGGSGNIEKNISALILPCERDTDSWSGARKNMMR